MGAMMSIWPAALAADEAVPVALAGHTIVFRHSITDSMPVLIHARPRPAGRSRAEDRLREAMTEAYPGAWISRRIRSHDGIKIGDGHLGNGYSRTSFTAFDLPPGRGTMTIAEARNGSPAVSIDLTEGLSGRRHRFSMVFMVPDFDPENLVAGSGWSTTDRDRWLEWAGIQPA